MIRRAILDQSLKSFGRRTQAGNPMSAMAADEVQRSAVHHDSRLQIEEMPKDGNSPGK